MNQYGSVPAQALDNIQPHFDEEYIYAGTAAYAMLTKLLSDPARERIIGAENPDALVDVLKETHFGTYLAQEKNLDKALERSLVYAKRELSLLAPNPHLLNILWLRYDFYNLKILLKRNTEGYDPALEEDIVSIGTHSFNTLEKAVQTGNGGALHHSLNSALRGAPKEARALEYFMESKYLEAALGEAYASGNLFAIRYVRLLTNLFAILSALRAHARGDSPVRIPSSDYTPKDIQSVETLLNRLSHIGSPRHWAGVIERYKETGNFGELDKVAEDYMMRWLKRQTVTLHSPAPLFAYWHVLRENVQLIRAASTSKKVGMDEKTLREIIRTSYNAYVY